MRTLVRAGFCPEANRSQATRLSEQSIDDFAIDVGQSEIASLKAIGQLRVIQAKAVQNCRLQIMHVNLVFSDMIAKFIRRPVSNALFGLARQSVANVIFLAVPVLVPTPMEQLHKPCAAFEQPPRQQTIVREGNFPRLRSV